MIKKECLNQKIKWGLVKRGRKFLLPIYSLKRHCYKKKEECLFKPSKENSFYFDHFKLFFGNFINITLYVLNVNVIKVVIIIISKLSEYFLECWSIIWILRPALAN